MTTNDDQIDDAPQMTDKLREGGTLAMATTALKMRAFERFPIAFVLTNPNLRDNPIVYVNRAFEQLTGYSADAAVGRNCRFLQGPDTSPDKVTEMREKLQNREPVDTVLLNYRADGEPFWNRLRIDPIYAEDGTLGCFLGLQQREPAEEQRDVAFTQLREIQHRVKNHLQMVVSMIRLQSERSRQGADEDYQALAHRVETLQLLYQELNDSVESEGAAKTIPMGAYISRIASAIGHLEGRDSVRLNIRTESFDVSVDTAARMGLIASEIITNSFRHAFDGARGGLVDVSLRHLSNGVMRFEVMDDGIGMPEGINWPHTNSMGGSIVKALSEGINAKLSVVRGVTGTAVICDIPFSGETNQEAN